jgi:hypothetical protein
MIGTHAKDDTNMKFESMAIQTLPYECQASNKPMVHISTPPGPTS